VAQAYLAAAFAEHAAPASQIVPGVAVARHLALKSRRQLAMQKAATTIFTMAVDSPPRHSSSLQGRPTFDAAACLPSVFRPISHEEIADD
jgi:hypothetical protein